MKSWKVEKLKRGKVEKTWILFRLHVYVQRKWLKVKKMWEVFAKTLFKAHVYRAPRKMAQETWGRDKSVRSLLDYESEFSIAIKKRSHSYDFHNVAFYIVITWQSNKTMAYLRSCFQLVEIPPDQQIVQIFSRQSQSNANQNKMLSTQQRLNSNIDQYQTNSLLLHQQREPVFIFTIWGN